MNKIFQNSYGIIFGLLVLIAVTVYFKFQENSYDSVIEIAAKKQRDFSEFIDFYGEIEPAFPDKILNAKTLTGVDVNNNGIRDDIDVWIDRSALNQNETKAMRQYSKAKQAWLKACETKTDSAAIDEKILEATECLASLSDYQRKEIGYAKKMLDFLIVNTDARKACPISDKHLPIPASKNFHCDFEIQYFNNVVFGNKEWKK